MKKKKKKNEKKTKVKILSALGERDFLNFLRGEGVGVGGGGEALYCFRNSMIWYFQKLKLIIKFYCISITFVNRIYRLNYSFFPVMNINSTTGIAVLLQS